MLLILQLQLIFCSITGILHRCLCADLLQQTYPCLSPLVPHSNHIPAARAPLNACSKATMLKDVYLYLEFLQEGTPCHSRHVMAAYLCKQQTICQVRWAGRHMTDVLGLQK